MLQGTGIRLKGVTFNNPALPKLINYKDLIAENVACVGAWRFDVDDLITEDGSGITQIRSWKTGGPAFEFLQGTNGKATRVTNAEVGGKVASFPSGTVYRVAGGFTWNPADPYTLLVVVKPDNYDVQMAPFGSVSGSTAANARIESLKNSSQVPIMRNVRGDQFPSALVPDPAKFAAFFGTFGGPSDQTNRIQFLDGTVASAANTYATATAVGLDLGSAIRPFAGKIDFAALFSVNLLSSGQAALKETVDQYLRIRTGVA